MIDWNNKFLVAGVSGTGKTWLSLWVLSEYVRKHKRNYFVFLSDNAADYNNPRHVKKIVPKENGFKLITFNKNHALCSWDWVKVLRTHKKIYIETGNLSSAEIKDLVNDISAAFFELGSGLFAIDEAWLFLNRTYNPLEFERLARGGRKIGVDLMAITQRVVDIHPDILSQFNVITSFRLSELNDRERISRYFEPFKGKDPRSVISDLKQGEYVIKLTETGEQEKNSSFKIKV